MTHTPIDIAALEALEKAATPGPWCRASGPHRLSESGHPLAIDMLCDDGDISVNQRPYRPVFARIGLRREEDTRFIVALRNDASELIKAVKERDEWRNQAHILRDNLQRTEEVLGAHSSSAEATIASLRALLAEAGEALGPFAIVINPRDLGSSDFRRAASTLASIQSALRDASPTTGKPE